MFLSRWSLPAVEEFQMFNFSVSFRVLEVLVFHVGSNSFFGNAYISYNRYLIILNSIDSTTRYFYLSLHTLKRNVYLGTDVSMCSYGFNSKESLPIQFIKFNSILLRCVFFAAFWLVMAQGWLLAACSTSANAFKLAMTLLNTVEKNDSKTSKATVFLSTDLLPFKVKMQPWLDQRQSMLTPDHLRYYRTVITNFLIVTRYAVTSCLWHPAILEVNTMKKKKKKKKTY